MTIRDKLIGGLVSMYLGAAVSPGWQRLAAIRSGRLRAYIQPDDPYSFLLCQILPGFCSSAGLKPDWIAVRAPDRDAEPEPDLRMPYAIRDAGWLAAALGLSFPDQPVIPPDSSVQLAAGILVAVQGRPDGLEIAADALGHLWAGNGDELAKMAAALQVPSPEAAASELDDNYRRLRRRGHYMGGMVEYGGRWYWGPDRLSYLGQRLHVNGLAVVDASRVDVQAGSVKCLEFYFSFRSPYSYLAIERSRQLGQQFDVPIVVRPVLPMVLRGLAVPRDKTLYIARDSAREASRYGVPFGRICDPVRVQGVERCLDGFVAATEAGRELDYIASIAKGIWSEAANVSRDRELRPLVERAGIEWQAVQGKFGSGEGQKLAAANREQLFGQGVWGVPTFCCGELVVWGQDRMWLLEQRLRAAQGGSV